MYSPPIRSMNTYDFTAPITADTRGVYGSATKVASVVEGEDIPC